MEDVAKAGKELAEQLGLQNTADEMKEKSKELVEQVKDMTKGAVDFFVEHAEMVSDAMKKANDTLGDKMNGMDQYVQCSAPRLNGVLFLARIRVCADTHEQFTAHDPRAIAWLPGAHEHTANHVAQARRMFRNA